MEDIETNDIGQSLVDEFVSMIMLLKLKKNSLRT